MTGKAVPFLAVKEQILFSPFFLPSALWLTVPLSLHPKKGEAPSPLFLLVL